MAIILVKKLCSADHICPGTIVCPLGALTQNKFDVPELNPETCIECGKCVNMCPTGALQLPAQPR